MSNIVISVENLSKEYRLGIINHGTLTHDLQSWWARMRGKEDPNQLLGLGLNTAEKEGRPDRFWALKDVSFEVNQGDVLGIIGRNGAGKSTLLKILSQVTTPSKGEVKIKGRIASLLEVGTGFHPELTGRENVFLNGAILGMSKAEITSKFDEIVDFAGIEQFIDTPVKRYSSGMYVRLAFAVAAHLEPEILIVDEVLAVGDVQFQKKCLGKMEEVGKEGRTILFVSHNMNAVQRLCGRAIILTNGAKVFDGEIQGAIANYLCGAESGVTSQAVFPHNPDKPFQIAQVDLCFADGSLVERMIKVSETFLVRIKFHLQKPLDGGYATLVFRNHYEEVVFFSDSRDEENSLKSFEQGDLDVSVAVPMPLLVPGRYSLAVGLGKEGLGAVDHTADVIKFEIADFEGLRGKKYGFIYYPLAWSKI